MKSTRLAAWSLISFALAICMLFLATQRLYAQEALVEEAAVVQETTDTQEASAAQEEQASVLVSTEEDPTPEPVAYIDENCDEQHVEHYTLLSKETTTLKAGWYVVDTSTDVTEPLVVKGDVRLIIQNNCTLSALEGIQVKKDSKLTLYGQAESNGALLVRKGVHLSLTPEEQQEEDERKALEAQIAEENGEAYQETEPKLLAVNPCLEVVAGNEEPKPAEEVTNPEDQPKSVEKPVLNNALLSKDHLVIRPQDSHEMYDHADGDTHYTCKRCDAWFEDEEGHVRIAKSDESSDDDAATEATLLSTQSVATESSDGTNMVTITFDANGGSGTMEPIQVAAGEKFTLPECTFDPPEGKVFSQWSWGKAGTTISVTSDVTARAWWKSANATGGNSSSSSSSTSSGTASSSSQDANSTSSSSSVSKSSSTSGNPSTADGLTGATNAMIACALAGGLALGAGKLRQHNEGE